MSRVRFNAAAPATFRARDGSEIRVTSLTLEVPDASAGRGTIGGVVVPGEEQQQVGREDPIAPQLDDVRRVWACYVDTMEPRHTELDPESRAVIRDALKVASADECCTAILGCKASAFHMGDNDRRRKFNRLTQILKGKRGGKTTREQIDMFLETAEKRGVQSDGTSADPAMVSQRKREVLDAYEFPGDEVVVERAKGSAAWLRDQGWLVEYDEETGRPSFRREQ